MSLMPGILFRYIFRQAAGSVAMIMASLTGVVWIALALKQLNLVTSKGQDAWLFFKMTLLALPNLMALIAPIALLVATIHVLNRLNGDSELIVTTAGGVMPITKLDGAPIGNGEVGPISQAIWKAYWEAHYDPMRSFAINY